jgi:hypothetical protein
MIAIGNGESRLDIDIDHITDTKVGCNAIIRNHTVEHLVCVDKRMLKECVQYSINAGTIYTRSNLVIGDSEIIKTLPELPYTGTQRWDDPFHWGSGPYAVLVAAKLSKTVKMIGFDLYSKDSYVNNCYKDTENYDLSTKRAVDSRYWIHQIGKVFECFPAVDFEIYQAPDWQLPEKWIWPNVRVDMISNFTYT